MELGSEWAARMTANLLSSIDILLPKSMIKYRRCLDVECSSLWDPHRMQSLGRKRQRVRNRRLLLQSLERRLPLHAVGIISGNVFFDFDGDGSRGPDEVGVPGAVVDLLSNDNLVSRTVITDDSGNYEFDELDPGGYRISKRETRATMQSSDAAILQLTIQDDEVSNGNLVTETAIRPEFIQMGWFFASSPSSTNLVREAIALGEELEGETELAALIRAGGGGVPDDHNLPPSAANDSYTIESDSVLTTNTQSGVLANDADPDGNALAAQLESGPTNGTLTLNQDGSFEYTPATGFSGVDSFTYRANNGRATSAIATATIVVNDTTSGNQIPQATNDSFFADENTTLTVDTSTGVLINDTDADGDTLTASVTDPPDNGTLTLSSDGSFTYQPNSEFFGSDSFSYVASDGASSSNVATVSITVRPVDDGTPFGSVTVGSFTEAQLLGIRTDLVAGAPAITSDHVDGDVDYSNHSNPPTYGDHHEFDPNDTDVNPGITPRPTGIYTVEQPDEDLVHNLEHGHVWISYKPSILSSSDVSALEQLLRDGVGNSDGSGAGVILTPREANDTAIALASWARLQTLDVFDPDAIRAFINTNRGKAPEGFITP